MSESAAGPPSGPTPRATAAEPDPARRGKKKRRPAAPEARVATDVEAAGPDAEPLETEAYVPSFARGFPSHAGLDALVVAFEEGNYARVRAEAPALAARSDEPPAVREAARELRRRVDPDPMAVVLIAMAVALLAFFAIYYWTQGHDVP